MRDRLAGGRREVGGADYLHLTADDIVPGEDWLGPMVEAADTGCVPVAAVVTCDATVLDDDEFPLPGNPLTEHTSFFEGPPPADLWGEYPDWSNARQHRAAGCRLPVRAVLLDEAMGGDRADDRRALRHR